MRLLFIVATVLLLHCSSELGAKSISKRHVRRDWLVIPDTIAFYIYSSVDSVSPSAGKILVDLFESPVVQKTRKLLMEKTSQLTLQAERLGEQITDIWNEFHNKSRTDQA